MHSMTYPSASDMIKEDQHLDLLYGSISHFSSTRNEMFPINNENPDDDIESKNRVSMIITKQDSDQKYRLNQASKDQLEQHETQQIENLIWEAFFLRERQEQQQTNELIEKKRIKLENEMEIEDVLQTKRIENKEDENREASIKAVKVEENENIQQLIATNNTRIELLTHLVTQFALVTAYDNNMIDIPKVVQIESECGLKEDLACIPVKIKRQRKTLFYPSSKNVLKLYCHAICSWAVSKMAIPYYAELGIFYSESLKQFLHSIRQKIHTIAIFREYTIVNPDDSLSTILNKIAFVKLGTCFLKYFAVNWIFSSNYMLPATRYKLMFYRFQVLRRFQNPVKFHCFS